MVTQWSGKSVDLNPSKFIAPLLTQLLERNSGIKKILILDFQKLDYMNSSTITPIIKILERAKRGKIRLVVKYNRLLKWQDLSFSALKIFQTKDKRVEIRGVA
ncbi:MAG: hypothetical protein KJO34_10980 [Deltaproteobacteria bacterium]|nr:hypothetical protein [Deltaproteobacteria bacterium]